MLSLHGNETTRENIIFFTNGFKMLSKHTITRLFKLRNARFLSQGVKPKGKNGKIDIDTLRKDPEIEVFGKKPRTGNEVVDELENLEKFSPMPKEMREGKVAWIYQRSKHVMQQGTDNTKDWILEFGTEQRWENPTMGWCSSGNPVSNLYMTFPNMCAAVCFAEKQSLKYVVVKAKTKKEFKNNYSDNFSWNKRTRISTK